MDSMRSSLERDRRLDGEWTTYNPALDRTVLKKARFLDPPVANTETKAAATAGSGNTSSPPANPKPPVVSTFAEKLAGALRKEE